MSRPGRSEAPESSLENLVSRTLGEEAPESLVDLLPVLTSDLAEIDQRIQQVLRSTYPRLTDAATYALSAGGKRVRPLLMAATARALGLDSARSIYSLAAAFQLIHTATLVHDDVIDHAEMRRGRPSMPRAFGLPSAIVTGDYLFVRAFELAAEYPRSIILRCGEACAALVEGEVLQDSSRFDLTTGREHYFRVIERKTAAIVAAALGSVAEIAEASAPVQEACEHYGRALGVAFQIRDDLLDVYGDPDLLGKPLYTDLREGNPTLVSLETYGGLTGAEQDEFERLFVQRRKQPGDLWRLRSLSDRTTAAQTVALAAESWGEQAVHALAALPNGPYRTLLEWLARGAAARRF
ncbi:MAG: polyprenyl synthetase family protein [Thermoplasmata archaeon]|nr:polyprenyl synthetase family protein [Thermoplasmata archaeon]MCI4359009.1 polyprenyl synthetase family protein [Thermoplasmata archaeon]